MSEVDQRPLAGRTVLVTGATGFIGGRLVEKLILQHGANVRALVRHYGHAARIARFDIEMASGSLEDRNAVDRAVAGADIVFNLVYVQSNSVEENISAISHLIDACLRHKVQRLVQISTFSVHEPFPDGEIHADTPLGPAAYDYPEAKIAVEQQVLSAVNEHDLPAVILRPSIVYGPFGGYWTDRPVKNLFKGRVVLPDDGSGLCNGVFVDDLVDAMVLAATRPNVIGEIFLISGPDYVTWKTFYETLEKCIGVKTLQFAASAPTQPKQLTESGPQGRGRTTSQRRPLRTKARSGVAKLASGLSKTQKRQLRRVYKRYTKRGSRPVGISNEYDYLARPRCRIDKAREMLGYDPKFDFEVGMAVTCEYLRWAYPRIGSGNLVGVDGLEPPTHAL